MSFFQEEQIVFVFVFLAVCAQALQSCPALCDSSPQGSSVHGILQARILECVAIPSSKGSSQPKGQNLLSYIFYIGSGFLFVCLFFVLPLGPLGKPINQDGRIQK